MPAIRKTVRHLCVFIGTLFLASMACQKQAVVTVENEGIKILFDGNLNSKVVGNFDGKIIMLGDFTASEFLRVGGKDISNFTYSNHASSTINDEMGKGTNYEIAGISGQLEKKLSISVYEDFPNVAVYKVTYTNNDSNELAIESWTNNSYEIKAKSSTEESPFWTYQSGSYENRPDWILPIQAGFKQENYMGMNATDYGGGTPVSDIWRKDVGIGVGHVEPVPKLVSLPVEMPGNDAATLAVTRKARRTLKSGESFSTFQTFVAVHRGDFFATLDTYRRIMAKKGVQIDKPLDSAYEPVWCAWGYERDFTMTQIYATLPKVKELGYKWAVLDDGWQTAEGDWYLNKDKFPGGDRDMQKFVKTINANGLKAKIWWAPLAVDPGTDLIKEHPEYLLLNEDGSKQEISWWDAYYLCPAYPPVQEYTKKLVTTMMKTWGYQGLKIDGQHLNGAPPCYNETHNHAYPEEAVEKVPEFFKAIYQTALSIEPEAVVEICPCGTAYSFFNLPYMNQPVSSDPESSWQIRSKGKTLKALMGPSAAYYGDHVELSDGKTDFASTVGIGGIVGTKFTWPLGNMKDSEIDLTPEKEEGWAKWNRIYLEKMLPKGIYRGELYDLGFDKPETHAIKKGAKMYYAFYAGNWDGEVELRGLAGQKYNVFDYVNDIDYGSIEGPNTQLNVNFKGYLLLEVVAQDISETASN